MTLIVGFTFIFAFASFTLNDVQGTVFEDRNDVIFELQRQILQIVERQKLYEMKLTKQQEIIDEQATEISSLKKIIFQKITINEERDGHYQTEEYRQHNSIIMNAGNTSAGRKENELSHIKKGYNPNRPSERKVEDALYDFQTSRGPHKRQVRAIAFSVYLSHSVDLGGQQIVRFDKIITNEGNGYNNHSGAFTCPEGGLYMFTYFVGESDIKGTWLNLKVNSVNMIDAAVDTYHSNQDLQGGNTVILRLKEGDVVLIESLGGHVEGSNSIRLTSFSGVLLSF